MISFVQRGGWRGGDISGVLGKTLLHKLLSGKWCYVNFESVCSLHPRELKFIFGH